MVKIKSLGTASKQTGILRPPLVLEKLGSDNFTTYEGWTAMYQSGTPTITAENGYLKVKFTASGYVLLGKKFNMSNTRHKAIYFKAMVNSYTSTYLFSVGFWNANDIEIRAFVEKNETRKLRVGYWNHGSATYNESTIDLGTGNWYECILVLYSTYMAVYIPDNNGNYVALGKRWKRVAYLQQDFTNVAGADTTVGVVVATNNACEIWYDIVELYEAGGEGLKDPEILSVWEDGVRKPYKDPNGYYYVLVHLSATPTGSVKYGNGKLAVFRTTDLKDLSKYEYYMLVWEYPNVSGDFIVYNNYVVILVEYGDFAGNLFGIGRAKIPLADFLNRNISALVDDGVIISGSYTDPKFFQDANGGWHGLFTGGAYRIFDLADPLSTPTNIRDMPSGWIEYPPYREHAGVLGVSDDNKLWGWLSATGGNNGVKFGKTDLSTWSDVYDPYYQDPNYTASEAYDFVVDGSTLIGIYQVPLETLPTESGWVLFTLTAPLEAITPAPIFVLESVNPSSIKVKVGSPLYIQVVIRNDGESGTCKVSLIDHAGNTQSTTQDTIEGGSKKTFTLNGTAPNVVTKVTYKVRYEAI